MIEDVTRAVEKALELRTLVVDIILIYRCLELIIGICGLHLNHKISISHLGCHKRLLQFNPV